MVNRERKRLQIPQTLQIDEYVHKIDYAYEILMYTAEWLIQEGKIKEDTEMPIIFKGSKRCLINNTPKHGAGYDFEQPKRLSNGLVMETKYSLKDCILYSRRLLEKFKVSSKRMKLNM